MSTTAHKAYRTALAADDAFSLALARNGFDRWDGRQADWSGEVRAAYLAKVAADNAASVAIRRAS